MGGFKFDEICSRKDIKLRSDAFLLSEQRY